MELDHLFRMGSRILAAPGHRNHVTEALYRAFSDRDLAGILKVYVDPACYSHSEPYFRDVQAQALFKKCQGLKIDGIDPKANALRSWYESERKCTFHNARLSRLLYGSDTAEEERLYEFFVRVKKRVTRWMGPVPDELDCSFGPGSVIGAQGQTHTVPDKMTNKPTTTASMLPYLKWWEQTAWARSRDNRGLLWLNGELNLEVRRASLWGTAPKNAETHRSTEIGQSINVSHQLGLGSHLKRAVARASNGKWKLSNQPDIHRILAESSSIDGKRATVDLSSASDSVCRALVKLCTPAAWYELMDDLRSKMVEMPDGSVVFLEKFSGMGNGFTFELESILFMSICQEVLAMRGQPNVAGKDVFVFGDDIIVDARFAPDVISALRLSGFETNSRKTFVDGPFRESCGGDYFRGRAVRPFYLKGLPREPQELIVFANGLRRAAQGFGPDSSRRDLLHGCWLELVQLLPTTIRRCRGPETLGDVVIHDEVSRWSRKTDSGGVRWIQVYRPVVKPLSRKDGVLTKGYISWSHFPSSVQLASRIAGYGTDQGVLPRKSVSGYSICWHPYS